ncbi:hypothetical protein SAMN04487906_0605 [Zhouia amylolytica]|uniref:Uncharacterized protein n=2 Tax=Zhouia amylolytica TaxID=376730 RepID=W2URC6_9FLAO|nr:hypothetical protein [Zhouia amylolytica]ETN96031.1 hypothetical protein P278_17530 [Zhouia amylolytica AD3]SFS50551.1 hypothetical protein SAMN04487906_0605 [Zhouia amylolytica]
MSIEEEKKLEAITRRMIQDSGLEKPSAGFMNRVMLSIQKEQQYAYTPLIKKWGWYIIASLLTAITVILIKFSDRSTFLEHLGVVKKIDFSNLDIVSKLQFSDTTSFVLIMAFSLILFQMYLIKKMYFKQFK